MTVGRRPIGATYSAHPRTDNWGEGEIIAYIEQRTRNAGHSGIEYDEIEKQFISDPWVDGWKTREEGKSALLIPVEPMNIRAKVRAERYALKLKGWRDCDEWMRSRKEVA